MDQVHVIRHKVLVDGCSQRQVAKEFGISRVTVRKYVEGAVPVRREPRARAPRLGEGGAPHRRLACGVEKLDGRETAAYGDAPPRVADRRSHQVGASLVKAAVAEWKRRRREVFVPLTYRPGDLAEVDFFEVLVDFDGTRRKVWLFLLRLMYSARDLAWIYERQDQVSFLDGHVRAFAHFGAVPA